MSLMSLKSHVAPLLHGKTQNVPPLLPRGSGNLRD